MNGNSGPNSLHQPLHDQPRGRRNSGSQSTLFLPKKTNGSPSPASISTSNFETFPPDDDDPHTTPPTSPRVHFRSRVRITSGFHNHRHTRSWHDIGPDAPCPSHSSSRSGSPSSSISAPLRSHPNIDNKSDSGWGPLGQRVSFLVSRQRAAREKETVKRQQRRAKVGLALSYDQPDAYRRRPNERTPLANSPMRSSYVERYAEGEDDQGCAEDGADDARLSREIDLLFGKWPGRLLNHHWWWWQLEPLFCGHCLDDSEMYE